MNVYNLIYLVTFVAKSWQSNNKHVKRRSALFNLVAENFRYEANVISSKSAKSLSHCSQLCLSNSQCNSLNYNFEMALCELLNLNPCKVAGAELSPEPGWTHFHAFSSDGVDVCQSEDGIELYTTPQQFCKSEISGLSDYMCRNLENIALGKSTSQSTTCHDGLSSRAVDGNSSTTFADQSCTHSCSDEPGDWWMVDFGATANVHFIKITNRGDCCSDRLSDFNVLIGEYRGGNFEANEACAMNQNSSGEISTFIPCKPMRQGRYLYVQQNTNEPLTLCEVEVYGIFVGV